MNEFELLSGVCQKIKEEEQSGTLKIQGEEREAYMYFRKGYIRALIPSRKRSILAEALKNTLEIDRKDLETIFIRQRKSKSSWLSAFQKSKLSEKFKENNFIARICRAQMEEEIYEMLEWPNVQCEFSPNQLDEDVFEVDLVSLPININPEAVTVEFARRQDEWRLIRKIFPSKKDIPYLLIKRDDSENPEEKHIMSFINGIRDFTEILDEAKVSPFKVMKILSKDFQNKKVRLRTIEELQFMAHLDVLKEDTFKRIRLYERIEELAGESIDTSTWLAQAYRHIEQNNKAIEKYRHLGINALNKKRYDIAVKAYQQVVDLAPENLEDYEKLIQACYKSNQLEKAAEVSAVYARKISILDKRKAIVVLDEANKNFPSSLSNLELMANLYLEMGDKKNAISTYNILGMVMRKQSKFELTLDVYRKIISIDPNNIQARIELGDSLIESGEQEEGLNEYKKLGELLYQKIQQGQTQLESKNLIAVCKCIIQYEPKSIEARNWLVDAYRFSKENHKALLILKELIALLIGKRDLEGLVENFRKLEDLDPGDFSNRKKLSETLLLLGKKSEAIIEYVKLGLETYEKNDMRKARESFEDLLKLDPFNLTARQKYAEILRQLNRQARAVEEYKLVALLSKATQQYEDAINAFSAVVELTADKETWAFLEMARLQEKLEITDKAIENYRIYATKSFTRGNYGEAFEVSNHVLELAPDDPYSLDLKKQAQEKLQQYQPESEEVREF